MFITHPHEDGWTFAEASAGHYGDTEQVSYKLTVTFDYATDSPWIDMNPNGWSDYIFLSEERLNDLLDWLEDSTQPPKTINETLVLTHMSDEVGIPCIGIESEMSTPAGAAFLVPTKGCQEHDVIGLKEILLRAQQEL